MKTNAKKAIRQTVNGFFEGKKIAISFYSDLRRNDYDCVNIMFSKAEIARLLYKEFERKQDEQEK